MRDLIHFAKKNGIALQCEGECQFCGANVSRGVFECLENINHITEILDFSNPVYHTTRFLSVDALALQHYEIHGPWNNYIHLTRLFLIFEKKVKWDYSKTPLLSNVINEYKRGKTPILEPPGVKQRGELTTADLLAAGSPDACISFVALWAKAVYKAFEAHHELVSSLGDRFMVRYYS